MYFYKFFILSFLSISLSFANQLEQDSAYPGGIAVVDIGPSNKSVTFDNKRVFTIKRDGNWYALIGISLSEKRKSIKVNIGKKEKIIKIGTKEYKKQYITLDGKKKKYVGLSKKNLDRHYKEKALSKEVLNSFSSSDIDKLQFVKPVNSSFSQSFGKRRYFNNQPRKPHSGSDMSGKIGTPIKAALAGKVKIARDFFFSGNIIYLDHGQGLITLYAHLDSFDVKEGDYVEKGQIIGKVGKTGRVTGPHLHYGVALNGNMVDPKLFY
jgi:murein DD-endopeptidase MepM/ murein hydrolase activator NlpD